MSTGWSVGDTGLEGLDRLASFLAPVLAPGDLVALSGDLGTGKTTFVRLLVSHLAGGEHEEIPSPTFALAQHYDARLTVTHVDCYRLAGADELDELGLDEALEEGAVLIEWAERVADRLPGDRLEIHLADGASEATRAVALTGHGRWSARLARLQALVGFCDASGWGDALVTHLQGDASTRSYARLRGPDREAILMDSPPMPDGPPVRDQKAYSAIAHLAEDVRPFVAVAAALRAKGLSAPDILAHDLERGFLILEDLGTRLLAAEIAAGADEEGLYRSAVDALLALAQHPAPERLPLPDGGVHPVPAYDTEALHIETELLLDWFWPALVGEAPDAETRAAFGALWADLFRPLDGQPTGWVLRDFHSPNLIWLPERSGVARVGILDFQDAVRGPRAYDLVSLAQDARRDIAAPLEARLLDHYCAGAGADDAAFDAEAFRTAYAILGAQRSTKILGIFARLAKRDGKRAYLAHIPRVSGYLERNLAHPALGDLKAWFDRHLPLRRRSAPLTG